VEVVERLAHTQLTDGTLTGRKPVLLIESDFKAAVTISRVFREMNLLDDLIIAVDCENALVRLNQDDGAKPAMILLDLSMPRMSAMSFLGLIKEAPELRMIPVVVLAESNQAEDVAACYSLGAAGYLVKSADYGEFLEKIRAVCGYWALSRLPAVY
jgi:DNA-binding NarL/FixJ family response regulator